MKISGIKELLGKTFTKKKGILLILIGIVVLISAMFPTSTRLHSKITALAWDEDMTYEIVEIHLEGKLTTRLFQPSVFSGKMTIGDNNYDQCKFAVGTKKALVNKDDDILAGITADEEFHEILIFNYNGSIGNLKGQLKIAGPTVEFKEALEIAQKLSK